MSLVKPLSRPPIARLWTGLSLSAIGDQLHRAAVSWLIVGLAGAEAGFLGAAEGAVVLAAALVVGAWAERWDHRRAMIGADLIRAGLAVTPVIAAAAHALNLWTLALPALGLAALKTVFDPALQASLPRLGSDARNLAQTNALMDATSRIARLIGPALAGALAAVLPAVALLGLNGLSFVASAAAVASLGRELPRLEPGPRRPRLELLALGLRAVRARPPFGLLLWRSAAVNGLWMTAIWFALPLVVRERDLAGFGAHGLAAVGLVMAGYGAGNLASNLVVAHLEPRHPVTMILFGNTVVGLGLVLMGLAAASPAPIALALLTSAAAFTALGGPITDIPMATLRQTAFPVGEAAAVYRLFLVADWAGMLVASAMAPLVGRMASSDGLIALCGVGVLATAAACVLRLGSGERLDLVTDRA